MSAVGFNTLEAAEDLQAAGLDEAHAKAIVGTVHRAMTEGMATKEHVSAEVAREGRDSPRQEPWRKSTHPRNGWKGVSIGGRPTC